MKIFHTTVKLMMEMCMCEMYMCMMLYASFFKMLSTPFKKRVSYSYSLV